MMYIWKEWKEQSRGKGIWLSLIMLILISISVLMQATSFPSDQGFEVFLLSLYDVNVYVIPLLTLFLASFSIIQEKEQKTLYFLLTKKESYRSFLWKKSVAVQFVTFSLFMGWYFILAIPMKFFFTFHLGHYLVFFVVLSILIIIFNQIGLFLGSIVSNRMQLIGANIFVWFLFIFLFDLITLYYLPYITVQNMKWFSLVYFMNPLHTLRFYLETSIGMFPLEHMSRLMEKMVWLPPAVFLLVDVVIWVLSTFLLATGLHHKGGRV